MRSSVVSTVHQITWCYFLECCNIGIHCQENVKSHIPRVTKLMHTREVGWVDVKLILNRVRKCGMDSLICG